MRKFYLFLNILFVMPAMSTDRRYLVKQQPIDFIRIFQNAQPVQSVEELTGVWNLTNLYCEDGRSPVNKISKDLFQSDNLRNKMVKSTFRNDGRIHTTFEIPDSPFPRLSDWLDSRFSLNGSYLIMSEFRGYGLSGVSVAYSEGTDNLLPDFVTLLKPLRDKQERRREVEYEVKISPSARLLLFQLDRKRPISCGEHTRLVQEYTLHEKFGI